ncbi:hypothetical protein BDQ17DRAFT_1337047 [Cyathus striatus]|nr:hypothetical protein BDQ17DRAFT_1337047 [Cyathus striatus]
MPIKRSELGTTIAAKNFGVMEDDDLSVVSSFVEDSVGVDEVEREISGVGVDEVGRGVSRVDVDERMSTALEVDPTGGCVDTAEVPAFWSDASEVPVEALKLG